MGVGSHTAILKNCVGLVISIVNRSGNTPVQVIATAPKMSSPRGLPAGSVAYSRARSVAARISVTLIHE